MSHRRGATARARGSRVTRDRSCGSHSQPADITRAAVTIRRWIAGPGAPQHAVRRRVLDRRDRGLRIVKRGRPHASSRPLRTGHRRQLGLHLLHQTRPVETRHRMPRLPGPGAPHVSSHTSRNAAAKRSGSPTGTKRPWTPSCTSSGIAPTGVAITGRPCARASSTTFGTPSDTEHNTSARDAAKSSGNPRVRLLAQEANRAAARLLFECGPQAAGSRDPDFALRHEPRRGESVGKSFTGPAGPRTTRATAAAHRREPRGTSTPFPSTRIRGKQPAASRASGRRARTRVRACAERPGPAAIRRRARRVDRRSQARSMRPARTSDSPSDRCQTTNGMRHQRARERADQTGCSWS